MIAKVKVEINKLNIPLGNSLFINDIDWITFENILDELGDHRAARLTYYQGELEIRMPTPEHERLKIIIGDLIKILLDELDLTASSFGSTTFKKTKMNSGIEPDDCFYIKNNAVMIGKKRIDLTVDPPPDLAIEIDLTSKTQIKVYQILGVSELWIINKNQLEIYILTNSQYEISNISPTFPNLPIIDLANEFISQSSQIDGISLLRMIRQRIRGLIKNESLR